LFGERIDVADGYRALAGGDNAQENVQAGCGVSSGNWGRPSLWVLGHQPQRRACPQYLSADELHPRHRVLDPGPGGDELFFPGRIFGLIV